MFQARDYISGWLQNYRKILGEGISGCLLSLPIPIPDEEIK